MSVEADKFFDGARPLGAFERMVALRYLRARRRRFLPSAIAGLSVTGITVAVMALIVVMSVFNGMHAELLSKVMGVNGHFFLQPLETPMTDYKDVAAKLERIPGILRAIPLVENPAGVSSPTQQTGALVRGITEADIKRLPGIEVSRGTLQGFDASGGLVIGERMANNLGVQVGDNVSVLTAKGAQTPFGITPRIKSYPIKAVVHFGLSDYDQIYVYMPLEEAQAFFNKPDEASIIEGFVADPEHVEDIRFKIAEAVERPNIVTDWRQQNKGFFDAIRVEGQAIFLILTIIIVVASLLIVQGLVLLVKDKTRDIAILRTMGARRGAVLRIFILTGVAIGVIGTIIGVLLGVPLALHLDAVRQFLNTTFNLNIFPAAQYFGLLRLPTVVEPHEVVFVVCLTLGLSFAATIYPAWRAAKLDPVEALRHE